MKEPLLEILADIYDYENLYLQADKIIELIKSKAYKREIGPGAFEYVLTEDAFEN